MPDIVDIAAYYAGLGQALLAPPGDDEGAAREYVRLFLSPQGAACPPWQSVYMAPEGEAPRLMGAAHHGALVWFRRHGFEPAGEGEAADHAGLLLLFYARLLDAGQPRSTLEAFRREHLEWLPRFAEKLAAEARHAHYRAVGEALREPVEID
jgi:putative dimethyl sulfoxide reductase chaperone